MSTPSNKNTFYNTSQTSKDRFNKRLNFELKNIINKKRFENIFDYTQHNAKKKSRKKQVNCFDIINAPYACHLYLLITNCMVSQFALMQCQHSIKLCFTYVRLLLHIVYMNIP